MDLKELKITDLWTLYQNCINYARLINMYNDTDINYRMYNGNQWYKLNVVGVEPVQLNYIKPIVNYKLGIINSNLWGIVFFNEFYENEESRELGNKICKLLNNKMAKIWENNSMDYKIRVFTKDAAVNDEGILYSYYKDGQPTVEVLSKNDVYYGNENSEEIQSQPYIIIKKRMSTIEAQNFAKENNVDNYEDIIGDNENLEETGKDAKIEKDPMVTVLTKFYKENDTVHYEVSTRTCTIIKDSDTGLKRYPITHMNWDLRKGSARGEGIVRNLIPNQIELNKLIMRKLLTARNIAFPIKIIDTSVVQNPEAADKVGATIKINGKGMDDVRKAFSYTSPSQMSTDLINIQNDLIQVTRELEGASNISTGSINPEAASGKAILAVQRASEAPLDEQTMFLKYSVEELARTWLDMIIKYSDDKIQFEEEMTDEQTGEEYNQLVEYPKYILENMKLNLKIEITPRTALDIYAQELSIENLLKGGYFNAQKLPELEVYVECLDNGATMNKQKVLKAIQKMKKEQEKIMRIQMQTQAQMQQAQNFLNTEPDAQAEQIEGNKVQQAEGMLQRIKQLKQIVQQ